jgi:hypothetical protein
MKSPIPTSAEMRDRAEPKSRIRAEAGGAAKS